MRLSLIILCIAPFILAAVLVENTELIIDSHEEWTAATDQATSVAIRENTEVDGNFDLMGNGALMLSKQDTTVSFWKSEAFATEGQWTSKWMPVTEGGPERMLELEWNLYGQPQDITDGWRKFDGNPLICESGWHHATPQTLQLPASLPGQPADQSLVRGKGPWEGKWLLIFNIGGWAANGWGMAVADSLAPLKRGINPFKLADPYPLMTAEGRKGKHAPNDWLYANGKWYTPDESDPTPDDPGGPFVSYMWSSPDLVNWTNNGEIEGMVGHDPGITYDGEYFHLFNEDGDRLVHCQTKDILSAWEHTGTVLEVGNHTGDADPVFFNNRWHLFIDDAPHRHYQIGYASTLPSQFPVGWQLTNKFFGPHQPEQQHLWDDDTPEGNDFGTGDADVAIEGNTLYMTHEWPVGIAWKELEVAATDKAKVTLTIEIDRDGDGTTDATESMRASDRPGKLIHRFTPRQGERFRIVTALSTTDTLISPMIHGISIR